MKSPTYGEVNIEEVAQIIKEFYERNKKYETPVNIIVGTDSQNFSDTKVVVVIAIQVEGHGGIYFYDIQRIKRVDNVRVKLNYETQQSLQYADSLLNILLDDKYKDIIDNTHFIIHVDAGTNNKGKTKELIPSIVGWIKACGYEAAIKPDSFVASSIADRISK